MALFLSLAHPRRSIHAEARIHSECHDGRIPHGPRPRSSPPNPLALRAWLLKMPKGADLHMHLSGAVYAETFIRDAAEDNLCVDTAKLAFVR